MPVEIPLSQGLVALVDEGDAPKVAGYKWHAVKEKDENVFYAMRNYRRPDGRKMKLKMHRVIMDTSSLIDHRDGNGLNNTRANLRVASRTENTRNQRKWQKPTSSRFKGVSFTRSLNKWKAALRYNGKTINLGHYINEVDAAWAYDREARSRFGFFARTNLPLPPMVI